MNHRLLMGLCLLLGVIGLIIAFTVPRHKLRSKDSACPPVTAQHAQAHGVISLESAEQFAHLSSERKPLIMLFYRPGCPFCEDMHEPFENVAAHNPGVTCVQIDTTLGTFEALANELKIDAVPTVVTRAVGKQSYEQLASLATSLAKS